MRGKSAVGVVLQRSLQIGRSGNIKTGRWEAGMTGSGRAESVQQIDDQYNVLVARLAEIDRLVALILLPIKVSFEERRRALAENMRRFEAREVTNEETARADMLRDIDAEILVADALLAEAGRGNQEIDIAFTPPTNVTTQTSITLATLGATATPPVPLQLVRGGAPVEAVSFQNAGGGQKFEIVAEATPTHHGKRRTVSVEVKLPTRKITWKPPAEIDWGTVLTIETLKAVAGGEGGGLTLDPADGKLPAGEAVTLTAKAPGARGKWLDGEAKATIKVKRLARRINWTLPKELPFGTVITATLLKAVLVPDAGTLSVAAPADGCCAAVGDTVVTVKAQQTESHLEAERTGTVKVVKAVPRLSWATPAAAAKDAKLAEAQLDASINPANLKAALVYAPATGTDLTTPGIMFLRVSFPGNDSYEPVSLEVRLQVVEDENARRGAEAVRAGKAWIKPLDPEAAALVKEWKDDNGSDPDSLKMMGQRLMAEIGAMTAEELNAHLDALQKKTADSAVKDQPGTYPNRIWTFKNGLQIRYKSNGDIHDPGKPKFCIEARTSEGPSASLAQVAFKLTPDGEPAAKGLADTSVPDDIDEAADQLLFKKGAQQMTHLSCRPKEEQEITWADLPDIGWDTTMSAEAHLNARALGGVPLKYHRGDKTPVVVGNKLPPNRTETLTAVAEETPRYKAAEKSVQIKIGARPK